MDPVHASRLAPPLMVAASRRASRMMMVVGLAIGGLIFFGCLIWGMAIVDSGAWPPTANQSQTPNAACDSVQRNMRFTMVRTVVNPSGTCRVGLTLQGHLAWVWQKGKTADQDKILICDPKLRDPNRLCQAMPDSIEAVAAADTEFNGSVQLLPP